MRPTRAGKPLPPGSAPERIGLAEKSGSSAQLRHGFSGKFDSRWAVDGWQTVDTIGRGEQAETVDDTETVTVADVVELSRFEARIGGVLAGFAQYVRTADLIVYPHTEVDLAFEGRGVGSALARAALDDARQRARPVLAVCPFIARWMGQHPEYLDLAYQNRSRVSD
jgi:uncharacterized protein